MYGIVGTPSNVPVVSYTAAKHGVIGLTRADAIAYAPKDIRINAICPGYVATPLVSKAMADGIMKAEIAKVPNGRIADMDEIADHITFLASPMSSYMHGAAMVADGYVTTLPLREYTKMNSNLYRRLPEALRYNELGNLRIVMFNERIAPCMDC